MVKLIQLSDLHLVPPGKLTSKVLDTNAILEETINEILRKQDYFGQIEGLLVTGDISDDGSRDSYLSAYEKLIKLIESNMSIATNSFGINGTPSVFVNGKKISSLDYQEMLDEIK